MSTQAGLVYVCAGEPGIRRTRRGKRFAYFDPQNLPVRNELQLRRIASLAIPPAYRDVWICADPRGHLQATGYDARGRKQYRYHPQWRTARDGAKFDRMIDFGEGLPRLRRRVKRDLSQDGLPRDKVLAVIVRLLDKTRIRIGNDEYARENKSFGLTTLMKRHLRLGDDGRATLTFNGKGGLAHEVELHDRALVALLARICQLPGRRLFQYLGDDGRRHAVASSQVNEYLKSAMGEDFTAKDFRTWGATLSAIKLMACMPLPERVSERALKSCIVQAVKQVAAEMRNTPAVCRKSYINPKVFEAWRNGELHRLVTSTRMTNGPRQAESVALVFLRAQIGTAGAISAASGLGAVIGLAPAGAAGAAQPRSVLERARPPRPVRPLAKLTAQPSR